MTHLVKEVHSNNFAIASSESESAGKSSAFKEKTSTSHVLRRKVKETKANETTKDTTISSTVQAPSFSPTAILDGSKLILRLGPHDQFTFDSPCKILLTTPHFKFERSLVWQTSATALEQENTVVIDANLFGHRFVPIPLTHYGTVYTKNGTVHVTVGIMVKRARVYSRNLPYRACNKFFSVSIADMESKAESDLRAVADWFIERQSTAKALGSIDPDQAIQMIRQLSSNPQQGVLYIRADDSMFRYTLKHDERIELPAGSLVAWTIGVRFEMNSYCCFRTVTGVQGEGTIWIQNNRTVAGRTLPGNPTSTL